MLGSHRFRRIITILLLIGVPVSLFVVIMQIQAEFAETKALRVSVERSYAVRTELLELLSTLQDIEVGQRGYVLTGNPEFLGPYEAAHARLAEQLLAARNGAFLQADSERLALLSDAKVAFAESTVELMKQGRSEEARNLIASGEGKRRMDLFRAEIARLDKAESARQQNLTQRRDLARVQAKRTIDSALAFLAVLLIISTVAIWRSMRLRHAALVQVRALGERNRAVLNSAVDGMLVLDEKGYIREANPSTTRLFGYLPDELIGMHNTELMAKPPALAESITWLRQVGTAGVSGSGEQQEFIGRRADGTTLATDVSISRFEDGNDVAYVAVIRDVTERKRIEEMKTEFVSTVSHELRTPLTSIGGSLGLLTAGAAGPLGEKAVRLVSIAHSNCERLIRLINDILDIEKIESGKMQFDMRRMPLGPLVDRTVQANRAFGDGLSVKLETQMPPWPISVMGDPDRLEQLLTNLISNAIKHSPADGTVTVAVTTGGGKAQISVRDRGAGIPADFRGRIFGKFAMADNSDSRRRGGTGLGLAIAREIAEKHGGAIGFADRHGGGTVFTLDLPMAECEDMAVCETGAHDLPRILHLDDNHDCLSVVASAFVGRATVIPATSVGEARSRIVSEDFAAVIVDVVVPPDNGLDLVPSLREDARGLPIIVYTALDDVRQTSDIDAVFVKSRAMVPTLVETTMALVSRATREAA